MKMIAVLLAVFYALTHEAKAVDIVCDAWTTGTRPSHIAVKVDMGSYADFPAAIDTSGNPFCKFNVDGLKAGAHTVRMKAVLIDAAWGRLESPESAPFDFAKPSAPVVPSGFAVKP